MSVTFSGLFLAVIASLLANTGHVVPIDALNTTLNTILEVVGAIMVYVGRYRLGGINALGLRV